MKKRSITENIIPKAAHLPKKAVMLATGLALGASLLAFSAGQAKSEDFLFGDTGEQTEYQLRSGQYPYYGRTILTRKHYRHYKPRRYYKPKRYRYPHRVRYVDPFFSPFYSPRWNRRHIGYHNPFVDPFYGGYGYHGHSIYFRFR